MLRLSSILLLALLVISPSYAADNYQVGDQLYVWAKSGLNLRAGPGTTFAVLKGIPFGAKVEIVEKSAKSYTFTLISAIDQYVLSGKVEPVNLKGNWVKIKIDSTIGYVIDQYLLNLNPHLINRNLEDNTYFKVASIDTTWINPQVDNGNEPDYCMVAHHDPRITSSFCNGGVEYSMEFAFSGYTIEEVLIVFGGFGFINYDDFTIKKNWEEKIELHDEGICDWTIYKQDGTVYLYMECSC